MVGYAIDTLEKVMMEILVVGASLHTMSSNCCLVIARGSIERSGT